MKTILIVDDDSSFLRAASTLLREDYEVLTADSGAQALRAAIEETPDLIILDLHLEDLSGFEVCEKLRNSPRISHIPIIMVTGDTDRTKTVQGLYNGADDCLCKPFDKDELLARVHARLRRSRIDRDATEPTQVGNLKLDPVMKQAWVGEKNINLTQFEFRMIQYFVRHRNVLVERRKMLGDLWPDAVVSRRTIDTHIAHLRKKIRGFSGSLETVYGGGYILTEQEASAS